MSSGDEKHAVSKVPFEEAINRAGFGVYSYTLTALTGTCVISFACVVYGSSILVPASACELETTSAQQGIMVAAPLIGTITGAIIWGYLADTRGRRSMLMVSLLSGAAVNAVISLSVNWVMMMLLQFTAALLASGQYSLPMTLLSESVPIARRNLVVLLVTSIFLLSQGIMAVLAIPIIPLRFSIYMPALGIYWNSWRTLVLVYCLPSLLCALWLYFMKESPKYVFAKGDEETTMDILKTIHRLNRGKSNEELQVKGILADPQTSEVKSSMKDQIAPLFKPPLLKYFLIMSTLSIFLQVGTFMVWLPTIANQFVQMLSTGEGADLTLCGIIGLSQNAEPDPDAVPCALNVTALLIVFGVGALQSLVNAVISLVINRVGRRNSVIAVSSICGVCGILVNTVPNGIGSAVLFVVFLLAMLLVGLYTAISVALFPTHLRALAVSLTMTGRRIMNFAVVQILNLLLVTNCDLGFYLFASIVAASAIVAMFLPDDRYLPKPSTNQSGQTMDRSKEDQDSADDEKRMNTEVLILNGQELPNKHS